MNLPNLFPTGKVGNKVNSYAEHVSFKFRVFFRLVALIRLKPQVSLQFTNRYKEEGIVSHWNLHVVKRKELRPGFEFKSLSTTITVMLPFKVFAF